MAPDEDYGYSSPPGLRRSPSSCSSISCYGSSPETPGSDDSSNYAPVRGQSFTDSLNESEYEYATSAAISPSLLSYGINQNTRPGVHPVFHNSSPVQHQRNDNYILHNLENQDFALHNPRVQPTTAPMSDAIRPPYFTAPADARPHLTHLEDEYQPNPNPYDLHHQRYALHDHRTDDLTSHLVGRSTHNPQAAALTALQYTMPSSPGGTPTPPRRRRTGASSDPDTYPMIVSLHENPFACPVPQCVRRFKRQEHLKRHERVHTKEKPYTCKWCQRPFSRTDNLKQHMRTHEKQNGRNQYVPQAAQEHFHGR